LLLSLENLTEHLLREGSATLDYLSQILMVDEQQLRIAVKNLRGLELDGDIIRVANRIKLALSAIERGVEPRNISKYLDWKEFEQEVASIFEEAQFHVLRNFRTTKPKRTETDVIALKSSFIFTVDCKHWNSAKLSLSRYLDSSKKLFERTLTLVSNERFLEWAAKLTPNKRAFVYPIIVTLSARHEGPNQWSTVASISHLPYIIQNFDSISEKLPHIEANLFKMSKLFPP